MDNEKYGIELELITSKFKQQVESVKSSFKEISNKKINVTSNINFLKRDFELASNQVEMLRDKLGRLKAQEKGLFDWQKDSRKGRELANEIQQVSLQLESAGLKADKLADKLNKAQQKAEQTTNNTKKISNATKNVGTSASKMTADIGKGLSKMSSGISAGMSKLKDGVSRTFSKMTSKIRRFGLALLSIRSIFSLVSRASSTYLSQNEALSNKVQNTWVKLGALLAPIIERIISLIDRAVNFIAKFIQGLTGINLLAKVSAKSIGKTTGAVKALNKALAGFDELTNLDTEASGGTGGGAGGTGLGFGDDDFDDYMNGILNAIMNADWGQVGNLLGQKLNEALSNIPWDKIKEGARTLATNITSFLNNFIETTDWELVGKTIAEGLNTAVEFTYTFITTFNWSGLGKSVGNTINGFIKNTDWVKVGKTISGGINGAVDYATTLIKTTDWSNLGTAIGETIGTAISGINWGNIGKLIYEGISSVQDIGEGLGLGFASGLFGFSNLNISKEQEEELGPGKELEKQSEGWLVDIFGKMLTGDGFWGDIASWVFSGFSKSMDEEAKTGIPDIIGKLQNKANTLIIATHLLPFKTEVEIDEKPESIVKKFNNIKEKVGALVLDMKTKIAEKKEEIKKKGQDAVSKVKDVTLKFGLKTNTKKKTIADKVNSLLKKVNTKDLEINLKFVAKMSSFKSWWNTNVADKWSKLLPISIPHLAVGTNYVPQDQVAMIHKGEAVIPRKFNSKQYFGNNDETNAKLDALIQAVNNIEVNPYTTIKDVGKASLSYINNKSRQLGESVVV